MSPPALRVELQKRLGAFQLDVAFDGSRGVTVLFGASGAGKSSILAAVAGVLRPDGGLIRLGETTLYDRRARIDLAPERRGIGWVFQDARLFPHLSVEANLRYGSKRAGDRPHRAAFDDVVEVLGVGALLPRRTLSLSGGEAQRVALGRALLSQPRLLLMDEPLAALDEGRKDEILAFIERVRDAFETPILYVTHALAEAARLADRMVVLDRGRVVAEGPLAAVMGRPDLPLLSARPDAAAAVEGAIARHDPARGLTEVQAGGALWTCPSIAKPVGAPVRLLVLAREVILATEEPKGLSARNVLPGRIQSLTPRQDGTVLALLEVGGGALLSAVTSDAVQALALRPGGAIWAVVKSVAIDGGGRGTSSRSSET